MAGPNAKDRLWPEGEPPGWRGVITWPDEHEVHFKTTWQEDPGLFILWWWYPTQRRWAKAFPNDDADANSEIERYRTGTMAERGCCVDEWAHGLEGPPLPTQPAVPWPVTPEEKAYAKAMRAKARRLHWRNVWNRVLQWAAYLITDRVTSAILLRNTRRSKLQWEWCAESFTGFSAQTRWVNIYVCEGWLSLSFRCEHPVKGHRQILAQDDPLVAVLYDAVCKSAAWANPAGTLERGRWCRTAADRFPLAHIDHLAMMRSIEPIALAALEGGG